jgi:hypothetical protein
MLPKPAFIEERWNVREADNRVRICLIQRTDIDHLYTSVEVLVEDRWSHVVGSAAGHARNRSAAEGRVQRLLDGGWRDIARMLVG